MATGRTVSRWARFYQGGTDYSAYVRTIGALRWEYTADVDAAIGEAVKGGLPDDASISPSEINVFFQTAAASTNPIFSGQATGAGGQNVMIPIGIQGEPAMGDPVFSARADVLSYQATPAAGMMFATIQYGERSSDRSRLYSRPWGTLLHAKAAETAASIATGVDDYGAATAFGGYMAYQVFAVGGAGTLNLKVQDAAANNNAGFADLSGATISISGVTSGMVELATTATVRRYLRWQISDIVGLTSITFALAFIRSIGPGY